jgi:hypothetical protein
MLIGHLFSMDLWQVYGFYPVHVQFFSLHVSPDTFPKFLCKQNILFLNGALCICIHLTGCNTMKSQYNFTLG